MTLGDRNSILGPCQWRSTPLRTGQAILFRKQKKKTSTEKSRIQDESDARPYILGRRSPLMQVSLSQERRSFLAEIECIFTTSSKARARVLRLLSFVDRFSSAFMRLQPRYYDSKSPRAHDARNPLAVWIFFYTRICGIDSIFPSIFLSARGHAGFLPFCPRRARPRWIALSRGVLSNGREREEEEVAFYRKNSVVFAFSICPWLSQCARHVAVGEKECATFVIFLLWYSFFYEYLFEISSWIY